MTPTWRENTIVALLLVMGVFFPTSIGGESREYLIGIALLLLLNFSLLLIYRHGTRPGAIHSLFLPILIVLCAGTLISCYFRFGGTIFAEYFMLATVLALNLRRVRAGRPVTVLFFAVNAIWILFGAMVLIGNENLSTYLTDWYSQFYPELVAGMLTLHKPILTFGTHSLAGFFTYLFFWLNWETYKWHGSLANLGFSICELILLIALSSFTSLAFAGLAILQIIYWFWNRNRIAVLTALAGAGLVLWFTVNLIMDEVDILWRNPTVAASVVNPENSGFLVRYAQGGTVFGTVGYIWNHPFSPIGFTYPNTVLYLGDSGPVEYLLRGSIPLLVLIYFGLYQFLRHNIRDRKYALTLFLFFAAFETGYNALPYFRTLYLLPFLTVYLNKIIPSEPPNAYVTAS